MKSTRHVHRTDRSHMREVGSQPDPKISLPSAPSSSLSEDETIERSLRVPSVSSSDEDGIGKEYGQSSESIRQSLDRISEALASTEGRSGLDRGKRSAFRSRLYSLENENGRGDGDSSSDLKRRVGELQAQVADWIKQENERAAPNVNRQEVFMDEAQKKKLLQAFDNILGRMKGETDWSEPQRKKMRKVGLIGDPRTYEIKRGPVKTYSWDAPEQNENLPPAFRDWKERQIAKFQAEEEEKRRIKKWIKENREGK